MRILLTTDTVGGVWTFTRELSTQLLMRGHDLALVSFGRQPSDEQTEWCHQQVCLFGQAFRYVSSDAPLEWMSNNEAVFQQDADLLLRVADSFQPDILHSNQFCYGALDLHIPKLITAHSDVLSWADACRPRGLDESRWLRRYRELVGAGIQGAHAVATPTRWMAQALRRNYEDLTAIHAILNGRTLQAPKRDRRLQAVSVGRIWDEAKNVAMLRGVNPGVPIFIAGEQQHETNAAPDRLGSATMLGHLNESALLELFSESSIYIATSIYEPFGLAPLEAALCGCAVVANDIPSLREVWLDAALYFNDAPSLSRLLEHLKSDRHALSIARAQSMERARQLTAERMADRYEDLYSELVEATHTTLPRHEFAERDKEFATHAG